MAKHLLQDMVKTKRPKKEFHDLPKAPKEILFKNTSTKKVEIPVEVSINNYVPNRSRYMLWSVALVSLTFCLFALSFLFSSAKVVVDPKIKDFNLNQNISAESGEAGNDISFNLVVIEGTESKTIQATEERDVKEFATGTVLIFNAFGSAPQRLDIDTRLEGSNGKIYKTKSQITVPGKSKDGTPGSVEVGIYGAEAGEDYNSGPLDFTIFGFKGTPKYSKFYGRSKGEIGGGFNGKAPYISDAGKIAVIAEMRTTLESKLIKKATAPGFVLFKDAVFLKTDDGNVDLNSSKDNMLAITLKGTLYGILFDENKLAKKIAGKNVEKYDGSDIFIPHIENLTFTLSNKENISFENIKNIIFNLSGPVKIVWKLDVNKFVNDLLGRSKKDFGQVLSEYPNINSSKLTLNPAWKMNIPDKAEDIKIIVNYPE